MKRCNYKDEKKRRKLQGEGIYIGYLHRNVALIELGFEDYSSYLNSDLWNNIRRRVFERDKNSCRLCDKPAKCAHHLSYDKATLRGVNIESVICVCSNCHRGVEFVKDAKIDIMDSRRITRSILNQVEKGCGVGTAFKLAKQKYLPLEELVERTSK